jgi:hypothetical protein
MLVSVQGFDSSLFTNSGKQLGTLPYKCNIPQVSVNVSKILCNGYKSSNEL